MTSTITYIALSITILTPLYYILRRLIFTNKSRISFVPELCVNLFDTTKEFPSIRVLHNDSEINSTEMLIQGTLINNGAFDIQYQGNNSNILIKLPQNAVWDEFRIVSSTIDMNAQSHIVNNKTTCKLTYDIFKVHDYIQFEAFISKIPKKLIEEDINRHLIFKHRIANTGKIKPMLVYPKEYADFRSPRWIMLTSIFAFFIVIFIGVGVYKYVQLDKYAGNIYMEKVSNDSIKYNAALINNKVTLTPISINYFSRHVNEKTLEENYKLIEKPSHRIFLAEPLIFSIAFLFFMILIYSLGTKITRNSIVYYKILKKDKNKNRTYL